MNDSRIRNNYFNWTMTYRSDSDIVIRDIYGGLEPKIPTENALHSAGFPFPEPKYANSYLRILFLSTKFE